MPAVLTAGAIKSTSTSDRFGTEDLDADIVNTNEVAGVNLLNGLVTLDALEVTTHSRRVGWDMHDERLCRTTARGIQVGLTTAQAGLPAGAVAESGFATSNIG